MSVVPDVLCEVCGIVTRRGRGPRPKLCLVHSQEYQANLRKTRYRRQRKYTAPVTCADCPAEIPIPEHGKPPKRCPACTAEHTRQLGAARVRRHRARQEQGEKTHSGLAP
jgi:hypothetical protein